MMQQLAKTVHDTRKREATFHVANMLRHGAVEISKDGCGEHYTIVRITPRNDRKGY